METNAGMPNLNPVELEVLKIIKKYGVNIIAKDIAEKLRISKAYVSKITRKLEKLGLIERVTFRPATYKITDLGNSLLDNGGSVFRVDALRVWFRVVRLVGDVVGWLEGVKFSVVDMRGWRKYFVGFSDDVHVEVNLAGLNPSVEVVFSRFWSGGFDLLGGGLLGRVFKRVWLVINWLARHGIVVDPESMRITNHEFESRVPEVVGRHLPKGVHRVRLGRRAKSLLGDELKQEAVAWIDNSLGYPELGTNDVPYKTKYILMPEVLWDLNRSIKEEFIPAVRDYTEQIRLHLDVLKKMEMNQEKMNQLLEKMINKKSLMERIFDFATHLIKRFKR